MTGVGDIPRTLSEFITWTVREITALKRRRASLPGRLSPDAQEVTNWNDATEPGFYWSAPGATNSPGGPAVNGYVTYGENLGVPRIMQVVYEAYPAPRAAQPFVRRGDGSTWTAWSGGDTDWVDVPLASGVDPWTSGERPMVRRIGNVVNVRGGIKTTGFALGTNKLAMTIPVGFRPVGANQMFVLGTWSPPGQAASCVIGTDGAVYVVPQASGTLPGYWFFGGQTWLVN